MAKQTRETSGQNIDPGVIQRIVSGVRFVVSGIQPDSWFSPGQPIPPAAQDQAIGRAFDYSSGTNTRITPRQDEPVTFGDLRGLAQYYDLLRLVIETRKDQIEAYEWEIVAIDDKNTDKMTQAIKDVTTFFEHPSLEHDWSNWLRVVLEDLLVIDAVAIYPRTNRGGELISLDIVDGATIKRVVDEQGRTPEAPNPAYQQILKGVPAVDYSCDMLIYMMRNPRSYKLYGLSPVEQIMMTVNIAMRRQVNQLQYYTEGNVPEAICGLPPEWTVDMVRQFQDYWDSILEGNTGARRHMKFVPFDPSKIMQTKDQTLKDEFDEWIARVVCFAFSIPPTAFVKQQNRATSETAAESAKEEGLMPLMKWLKRRIDYVIRRYMGQPGLEFRWKTQTAIDPVAQATIDDKYIRNGSLSIDEVRQGLGREPLGIPNLIFTMNGATPLDMIVSQAEEAAAHQTALNEQTLNPPAPVVNGASAQPGAETETTATTPVEDKSKPAASDKTEADDKAKKVVADLIAKK